MTSTAANKDGIYWFDRDELPPGEYRLRFGTSEWWENANAWPDATPVTVTSTDTAVVNARITNVTGSLSGTAIDGSNGLPAVVQAFSSLNGRLVATTVASDQGHYTFDGIAEGSYWLRFEAVGRAPTYFGDTPNRQRAATVEVVGGQETNAPATTLPPESRLTGTLLQDGQPALGVHIVARTAPHPEPVLHATSAVDGRFEASGLASAAYELVLVDLSRGAEGVVIVNDGQNPPSPLQFTPLVAEHLDVGDIDVRTGELIDASPPPPAEHCGTIDGHQTWVAGRTHRLTCTVTVPQGAQLTVEAGAQIGDWAGHQINVEGNVAFEGSASSPVFVDGHLPFLLNQATASLSLENVICAAQCPITTRVTSDRGDGANELRVVSTVLNSAIDITWSGSVEVSDSTLRWAGGNRPAILIQWGGRRGDVRITGNQIFAENLGGNRPGATSGITGIAFYGVAHDSHPTISGNTIIGFPGPALAIASTNIDPSRFTSNTATGDGRNDLALSGFLGSNWEVGGDATGLPVSFDASTVWNRYPIFYGGEDHPDAPPVSWEQLRTRIALDPGIQLDVAAGSTLRLSDGLDLNSDSSLNVAPGSTIETPSGGTRVSGHEASISLGEPGGEAVSILGDLTAELRSPDDSIRVHGVQASDSFHLVVEPHPSSDSNVVAHSVTVTDSTFAGSVRVNGSAVSTEVERNEITGANRIWWRAESSVHLIRSQGSVRVADNTITHQDGPTSNVQRGGVYIVHADPDGDVEVARNWISYSSSGRAPCVPGRPGIAVHTWAESFAPSVTYNHVTGQPGCMPYTIESRALRPSLYTTNTAANNAADAIFLSGVLAEDSTWPIPNSLPIGVHAVQSHSPWQHDGTPQHIPEDDFFSGAGQIVVPSGRTLTIEDGYQVPMSMYWDCGGACTIYGANKSFLVHGGWLDVRGSSDNPVAFGAMAAATNPGNPSLAVGGIAVANDGTFTAGNLDLEIHGAFGSPAIDVTSGFVRYRGSLEGSTSGIRSCPMPAPGAEPACYVDARYVDWGTPSGPSPYGTGPSICGWMSVSPWVDQVATPHFEYGDQYHCAQEPSLANTWRAELNQLCDELDDETPCETINGFFECWSAVNEAAMGVGMTYANSIYSTWVGGPFKSWVIGRVANFIDWTPEDTDFLIKLLEAGYSGEISDDLAVELIERGLDVSMPAVWKTANSGLNQVTAYLEPLNGAAGTCMASLPPPPLE